MIVLGVDSGGTKTKSIIVNSELKLLGIGIGGAGNYQSIGIDKAKNNIGESIEKALSEAGIKSDDLDVGGFGIAGLDTEKDYNKIWEFLDEMKIVEDKYLVNDVVISHYGCLRGKPGVTIVAGTGSISYGVNKEGEETRVGGWGWLIGDEGSGFYLARRGLQEATRAYDGRSEETILEKLAINHFDLSEFEDLFQKVYEEFNQPADISSFAEKVIEGASKGDETSIEIVEDACEELFLYAKTIKQKLGLKDPLNLGLMGGLFSSDLVVNKIKNRIKRDYPNAKIMKPVDNPVVGAVALALEKKDKDIKIKDLKKLDSEILNKEI